ncbi:MAG: hypothetical protein ACRD26_15475, partial [Vicinamibacterales bacterium]
MSATLIVAACSPAEPPAQVEEAGPVAPRAAGAGSASAAPGAQSVPRIVILGDSLTAGLGLEPGEAFPS